MIVIDYPDGEKELLRRVVQWCYRIFQIPEDVHIAVAVERLEDCWGCCESTYGGYLIILDDRGSLGEMVGTLIHEMVHVDQWSRGFWWGDGEDEAEELSRVLAPVFLRKI